MNRLKSAAWLSWGRIGLAWPQRGWGIREIQPGGLEDKPLKNWLGFSGGGGLGWRGRLAPSPPSTHRKYPAAMYNFCGILFVSVERWHCAYMGASATTNTTGRQLRQIKIPWQWVSCAEQRWWTFIYMVVLKRNGLGWAWQYYQCQTMNRLKTAAWLGWGRNGLAWPQRGWGIREIQPGGLGDKQRLSKHWLGLAWFQRRWGVGGERGGLPPPPKHTPQISGCDVQFLWHFVCVCGAMALCVHGSVCDYKHDWAPAASNKDTVAMGFVRGTAMVDFHIHGRVEKKWFGLGLAVLSVPDNESVKNSGLARLGSDRVGLATERVGNSGDSAGGLGR